MYILKDKSKVCFYGYARFPPERNCTHPWNKKLGCVFFFLQDSFGLVMPYSKPDIEPSENWKNLDRDDLGRFRKNKK